MRYVRHKRFRLAKGTWYVIYNFLVGFLGKRLGVECLMTD